MRLIEMNTDNNTLLAQEKETGRVEAFSDGVFAIAITLLVLDLKVPHINTLSANSGLFTALLKQWPAYLAFFISFFTILIMWVNHHNIFNYVQYIDGTFLFLNGFLLLTVTFIPFPTSLLADYIKSSEADIASSIYAGTFFFNCLSFNILWLYSSRERRLINKNIDQAIINTIKRNGLVGLIFYILAIVLAFISVTASISICFILAVFYALTGSLKQRSIQYEVIK